MPRWKSRFQGTLVVLALSSAATAEEGVLTPGKLLEHYTRWQDQQVTVAAYPALFMSPAHWREKHMEFGATPEPQTPTLVVCDTFTPPNDARISSTDLVVLRGSFARRQVAPSDDAPHRVVLKDCVMLDIAGQMPPATEPLQITDAPMPIGAFHAAVFDIIGKTVRVKGYYWGKTWSSASDQTRHDLQDTAEFRGKKPVGCFQDGKVDPPQEVMNSRDSTVVEGQVGLTAHSRPDRVDLINCRFVQNRE